MPPLNLDLTDADREALQPFLDPMYGSEQQTGSTTPFRFVKAIPNGSGEVTIRAQVVVDRRPKKATCGSYLAALLHALQVLIPQHEEQLAAQPGMPDAACRRTAIAYLQERIQTAQAQGGATIGIW